MHKHDCLFNLRIHLYMLMYPLKTLNRQVDIMQWCRYQFVEFRWYDTRLYSRKMLKRIRSTVTAIIPRIPEIRKSSFVLCFYDTNEFLARMYLCCFEIVHKNMKYLSHSYYTFFLLFILFLAVLKFYSMETLFYWITF